MALIQLQLRLYETESNANLIKFRDVPYVIDVNSLSPSDTYMRH